MLPASNFSVSVIVPHYNRPDSLRDALVSIHNQTLQPKEVLVVDDCSSPEARRRVESYSDLASILSTPRNMGLSGARNFGADAATGDWLAFLDDDDLYLPYKLERQVRFLRNHPDCVALGAGLTMRPPDGNDEYWGGKHTQKLEMSDALYYTASTAQSLMIRRDFYQRLGGYDERLRCLEDYELGIRIVASGEEMQFLAEPMFIYHLGGREQLSRNWSKMLRADLRILTWHRKLCVQEFGRLGYLRMIARCCRIRGLRRGHLVGRSLWLAGSISDAIIGMQRGEYY